ncbi:DUF881 domain-containing protein [Catellatospora tritici]|uniref:DUF881 domain-containing protein n=1 Tax=Catellatospora tritici TaxID=2851566 RepID=UPI001C2CF513|nr:DUF881 domain-containing protein [Catellatospora tritici]MBV1853296.1 DUF881 domain-containing protein [Catellatospora tritici]
MEYTSGTSSWRKAVFRALRAFRPGRRPGHGRTGWTLGVPLIAMLAGLLFTLSATASGGFALREDRRVELSELIDKKQAEADRAKTRAEQLRNEIDTITRTQAGGDGAIIEQQGRGAGYLPAAGLSGVHGPGLTVRLNDAPKSAQTPDAASQDDLVVHQQDVQAVVNALWAGGAEAMTIMGQRVITTTAVQCVGNTLLLDGRRYSPEFVISAIGDPAKLRAALDAAPGVQAFRAAVRDYGLGYSVSTETNIVAPPYQGSVELRHASVPHQR